MNSHFPSRTSLFLIELMISIFFFIISTTIVLQLFVKSYQVSQKTIYTNNAYQCAQNISELFLGSNADSQFVHDHFSTHNCFHLLNELPNDSFPIQYLAENNTHNNLLLLYDKDWNSCTTLSQADFFVYVFFSKKGCFSYETIYITSDIPYLNTSHTLQPFYELTIQKYIPQYTDPSIRKGEET